MKCRGIALSLILGSLLVPAVVEAQQLRDPSKTQKEIWQWTVDERLAIRLDPARIVARSSTGASGARPNTVQRQSVQNYEIDGGRNPELLLPHELLESLLTGFVSDERRRNHQRENFRAGIAAAGFDEESFWPRLQAAVSGYLESSAHEHGDSLCRQAFMALNNARQTFGREPFDRFLYETVAPHTQVVSATSSANPAAELRFVAAGCR